MRKGLERAWDATADGQEEAEHGTRQRGEVALHLRHLLLVERNATWIQPVVGDRLAEDDGEDVVLTKREENKGPCVLVLEVLEVMPSIDEQQ